MEAVSSPELLTWRYNPKIQSMSRLNLQILLDLLRATVCVSKVFLSQIGGLFDAAVLIWSAYG